MDKVLYEKKSRVRSKKYPILLLIFDFATKPHACLLPFTFCLLPFAFCLLPFAFYLLPFAFCLLPFAFWFSPFAFCLLVFAFCLLAFAFWFLPFAFWFSPFAFYFMLCPLTHSPPLWPGNFGDFSVLRYTGELCLLK